MRKFFWMLIMSITFVAGYAQTEPEFEMEPYVFHVSDSTISSPLPCESAYIKAKAGASLYLVGVGKVKTYYYINGVKSPLEIDRNTEKIVINIGGTSPQQILSVIKLETLENKRRWKTGEAGLFTGVSSNEDNSIVFKYKRYGNESVVINTSDLEVGEYCLAITNMMTNIKSAKVYTFRVRE